MNNTVRMLLAGILLAGLARCAEPPEASPYVARVGDQYLTQQALDEALAVLPAPRDTIEAREQIIEQWVTNALLYREAQRRNLADAPNVQKRLKESRRSVLVSALIDHLYQDAVSQPTDAAVRAYFERHREQLRLHEPFVSVRHLATANAEAAQRARQALQEAMRTGAAAARWPDIARRYALDASRSTALAGEYYAQRVLFNSLPAARSMLGRMDPGEIAPLFEAQGRYHVLQLVERIPAGTLPKLEWLEDEVRRRVLRRQRKQMYARQVQRLRNEARSRGVLDIRSSPSDG